MEAIDLLTFSGLIRRIHQNGKLLVSIPSRLFPPVFFLFWLISGTLGEHTPSECAGVGHFLFFKCWADVMRRPTRANFVSLVSSVNSRTEKTKNKIKLKQKKLANISGGLHLWQRTSNVTISRELLLRRMTNSSWDMSGERKPTDCNPRNRFSRPYGSGPLIISVSPAHTNWVSYLQYIAIAKYRIGGFCVTGGRSGR